MKSFITSIGIANPTHCIPQMQVAEFMKNSLGLNREEGRRLSALYRASGIEQRYSIVEDFRLSSGSFRFFPNCSLEQFPTVSERMNLYKRFAADIAMDAINDCVKNIPDLSLNEVSHIITVSCTGMYAPGLDIEIVEKLGLRKNIQRTAINFMGCYAAFNALKAGDWICKSNPEAKVLIVCVEFCTIHLQKKKDLDNLLSNTIFGDGAAAVIMETIPSSPISLSLDSFYCDLATEGKNEMAWHIADFGFEMVLTSYVPTLIRDGINNLANNLLQHLCIGLEEIDFFAIHPGGKKILEAIEESLGLTKEDNRFAYEVMRKYGNMSSPTVLFVLYFIWKQLKETDKDKKILSFAFGPGLTLESMLLNVSVKEEKKQVGMRSAVKKDPLNSKIAFA